MLTDPAITRVTSGGAEQWVHPRLASELKKLDFDDRGVPDADSWVRFLDVISRYFQESDEVAGELGDAIRARSSFESLFRIAPVPMIEQDYSVVQEWMDDLRAQGVTSIRDHLGDDIEAIRAVVPMIRIVGANPAAVNAVGIPLESLIGPIDPKIVNDGSQASWLTQLDAVWNRQAEAVASYTAETVSGQTYDADSILAAPLIDGEPDFSRAVFTLIDVTDHRNEERRMEELVKAKSRFLASVSHEIRTPLTAILGFGRILEDDRQLDEDDRALMVSSIVQYSQEVADLVEDLLVAARVDNGQIEVVSSTFDVMAQLRQTLKAGGSFTTDVDLESESDSIRVIGDPIRVRQIMRNLLTNAERYGGSHVTVQVTRSGREVFVDVADDGPVLPKREWERIFEPYYTIEESPGRPGSVGIGLAISRQLAELMGGRLHYRQEGDVSSFRLALKAAPAQH
jgi:signal transduction histidine kinase